MITLFSCENLFKFVSFLLYPTEVKRLKSAMLGAFTINSNYIFQINYISLQVIQVIQRVCEKGKFYDQPNQ